MDISTINFHPLIGGLEITLNHLQSVIEKDDGDNDVYVMTFETLSETNIEVELPNGQTIQTVDKVEMKVKINFMEDKQLFNDIVTFLESNNPDLTTKKVMGDSLKILNQNSYIVEFSTKDINGNTILEFKDS